jgi:hypothetical protein
LVPCRDIVMDKQLKSLLVKLGALQTIMTIVVGIVVWSFGVGRASADIVRQSDLISIDKKIDRLQEDVAYMRGRMDK